MKLPSQSFCFLRELVFVKHWGQSRAPITASQASSSPDCAPPRNFSAAAPLLSPPPSWLQVGVLLLSRQAQPHFRRELFHLPQASPPSEFRYGEEKASMVTIVEFRLFANRVLRLLDFNKVTPNS
ncbi:hypothetical protein Bca52824_023781 [Brassica carinata]|uniref:Uncharacterized protein n=1 Tax=Brassica carinata TaxID=52824 RepID=A0A8X7VIX9_BRACI|nr:hypothetical protein Bca52824_023781 [Brassica carinata]